MGKPIRILLVEDQATDAELLIREVQRAGFTPEWQRVETEADFLAGLADSPDLVLSDYSLPHFDGIRAVRLLRERGLDIPFILVSATLGEEAAVEAMKLGVDDYLLKDRLARLGQAIEHVLEEKRLRDGRKEDEVRLQLQATALQESEALFREFAEFSPHFTWMCQPDGANIYFNQRWVDYTGLTLEESSGDGWNKPFHPEDQQRAWDAWQEATLHDAPYDLECRLRRSDGQYRWFDIVGVPVRDAEGKVSKWFGTCTDIHDRKQAEDELFDSRKMLRTVLDTIPQRVFWKDRNSVFLGCNQPLARDCGYADPSELIGKTDFETTVAKDAETYRADDRQVMQSGEAKLNYEERQTRPDGTQSWLQTSKVPLHDHEGHINGVLCTYEDITERKQAEENLVKVNERFDLAIQAARMGIWDWDVPKNQLVWDDRMFELYGVHREDFSGAYEAWAQGLHPEDVDRCHAELQKALRGEKKFNTGFRVVWPDGAVRHIRAFAQVVRDANGQPLRMTGINTDITKRKQGEEALRLLASAVEQSKESILITDAQLELPGPKIIFVNPAFTQMTGYTAAEVIGKTPRILQGPKTDRAVLRRLRENLAHGEVFAGGAINYRKDGSEYDQEWQAAPIRDAKGTITHYVALQLDVTERKQAEAALRESEIYQRQLAERLTAAQAVGNVGSWETNLSTMDIIWSKQTHQIFETDPDTFSPNYERFLAFVHPDDRDGLNLALRNSIEDKNAGLVEHRIVLPDGRIKVVEERWSTFRSELEKPAYTIGTCRDITERKRAEEKLAEQAALLDQTHDAIMVVDMQGQILFWSKGAERLYGWTKEEAIGRDSSALLCSGDQTKKEELWMGLREQGDWQGELNHLAKDGSNLVVETRCTLVARNERHPESVIAISRDITEKKKIEAQFLRAQRMESIGTLASGIAHDLNNILTPILMSVEMLKCQVQSSQALQMLETLEVSAQRGSDIVRQVLSFGRGLEGARFEVQLKHLVKDIEHILRDTFPKNIEFHLDIGEEIWTILGDPTQLHQVLLNLSVNARDAMPEGGSLTISAKNQVVDEQYAAMNFQAKPGHYVVLSVTDTGSGIPARILDKIFDPFFTTKEIGKGTGLGLSTVLGIVKSHDGFMNVYSEPGKGTTFRLHLSAKTASSEENEDPAHSPLPRGNGELVLVIDDEPSILTITSQTLEAFGYRVLVANNGAVGIAIFAQRRNEIAVVLTDMMMPVMDGLATISAMTTIHPTVKIIASSGLNSHGGTAKAISSGVTHFLNKPYTAQTLLEELRLVLEEP